MLLKAGKIQEISGQLSVASFQFLVSIVASQYQGTQSNEIFVSSFTSLYSVSLCGLVLRMRSAVQCEVHRDLGFNFGRLSVQGVGLIFPLPNRIQGCLG